MYKIILLALLTVCALNIHELRSDLDLAKRIATSGNENGFIIIDKVSAIRDAQKNFFGGLLLALIPTDEQELSQLETTGHIREAKELYNCALRRVATGYGMGIVFFATLARGEMLYPGVTFTEAGFTEKQLHGLIMYGYLKWAQECLDKIHKGENIELATRTLKEILNNSGLVAYEIGISKEELQKLLSVIK